MSFQSVEGFVCGSENGEFLAQIFKRRSQASGFDRGRKSGEALVAQDGAYQTLRRSQRLINDMNDSIAGQDIELRHVSSAIDDNPAVVENADAKVIAVGGLDNAISKSSPENLTTDDMVVQENVRKSVRIPELGERQAEAMPIQR